MKLEEFLQNNYGYNPAIKDEIKTYIEQWNSWYQGNVKSFHNYFIYNGQRKTRQKRYEHWFVNFLMSDLNPQKKLFMTMNSFQMV